MGQNPSLSVHPQGSYQDVFCNRMVKSSCCYSIKNIREHITIGKCLDVPRKLIAKNNRSKKMKLIKEIVI
jgi:hypothetical protein